MMRRTIKAFIKDASTGEKFTSPCAARCAVRFGKAGRHIFPRQRSRQKMRGSV